MCACVCVGVYLRKMLSAAIVAPKSHQARGQPFSMLVVVDTLFGINWQAAFRVAAPSPVPDQAWPLDEEQGPQLGVIADCALSGWEFAEASSDMAPKALLGIRPVFEAWLGERHEAAKEPAVDAEIMRFRKELNRYNAAAGDEPADEAIVYAELQTTMLPVIANYAHILDGPWRFARSHGLGTRLGGRLCQPAV